MSQEDDDWNRTVQRVVIFLMVAIPLAIILFYPDSDNPPPGMTCKYRHDTGESITPGCD